MRAWMTVAMTVLFVCACCVVSPGQESEAGKKDAPPPGVDWKEAANKAGLTPGDVAKLSKDNVLISNETCRQVFDPYIHGRGSLPLFITSDSVLNAFHVLYEESVLRMERANARKLPEILRFIWAKLPEVGKGIKGKPELVAAARRRAQVVIGTALRLCGDTTTEFPPEIAKLVEAEVKRVEAAEGTLKPAWLGPPDKGFVALDYSRYKPRGFYTKSPSLQRYFRAVSWLQSIPFRVANDEELLSILMLGRTFTYRQFERDFAKQQDYWGFFERYRQFIGSGDDWDLTVAAHKTQSELRYDLNGKGLTEKRERLMGSAGDYGEGPQINDQVRFAPLDPAKAAEPEFRILSAYRTPDAILFQRTTDLRRFKRDFPSGLEVCAALGSSFAASRLPGEDSAGVLKTIEACKPFFDGHSLYVEYLDCLSALLDEPERDAPSFMKNDAWKTKSCQTALAGWAQLRHTWALQAKQTVHYLGLTRIPPGFVEPDPEFFARLGRLVDRTEGLLKESGAMKSDLAAVAARIRKAVEVLRRKDFAGKGTEAFKTCTADEAMVLEGTLSFVVFLDLEVDPNNPAFWPKAIDGLTKLAADVEKGDVPDNPMMERMIAETEYDIASRWRALGDTCRRLEALAHKQLRGVPFSREENGFIEQYGTIIAGIMLYGGNSYLTPKDDAPRIVDVYANPNVKRKYLEVGVARPRVIYVLYPWKGGEVLTVGAVMPYYEFTSDRRLTDGEWKSLLDSDKRPDSPDWLKPILAPGKVQPPTAED